MIEMILISLILIFETFCFAKPELAPGEVMLNLNAPSLDPDTYKLDPDNSLPRNWRTSLSPYQASRVKKKSQPSREGLANLSISGSAEFSQNQFKKVLELLQGKKITVVDLRQEPHGFVNEMAMSWYGRFDAINEGKTRSEILADEEQRISNLGKQKTIQLQKWISVDDNREDKDAPPSWKKATLSVQIKKTNTEKDFLAQLGVGYFRIPVPDFQRPKDEEVDLFVDFVKKLPKDTWLHFHCAAGQGRTTTFMTMFDMMRNSSKVSSQDLIGRQYLLGGVDLLKTLKEDPQKRTWAIARAKFIQDFYKYCKAQGPEFKKTWSVWRKEQR